MLLNEKWIDALLVRIHLHDYDLPKALFGVRLSDGSFPASQTH